MSTAQALPLDRPRPEPWHIGATRAALYALSFALYLLPLATGLGLAVAALLGLGGLWGATVAHRRGLRLPVALLLGLGLGLLALGLGEWVVDADPLPGWLGTRGTLALSELFSFGLTGLCAGFVLRFLALTARSLSLLEVLFVAGSAVTILADHRNKMLNRPRFLSDWAWSIGLNPATVLMAVGIGATLAAILLFLRGQRLLKLITSLALLLVLGLTFYALWDASIKTDAPRDALGLSGKKSAGGGAGEGGGSSDNPFKNDYDNKTPPSPVAIAILRDDLPRPTPILYFRQTVQSLYNGHHLVNATDRGRDRDVITRFPGQGSLEAEPTQSPDNHVDLPTTMFLLVDHPQPLGLTHSRRITLVQNPNPQHFVAAYDVMSRVLSVPPRRLLGRRSVPAEWSANKRRHYLTLPEDPRYRALADIVVRDVDPRFASDDLARAFAIKRYLEREGVYTMRSKHASRDDPTASFLFGSLRGYCVHFAHAAVYLLRSQGIAARVALGYAVQINKRAGGSSILIMSDRAHAWPEIHLEGIGWVTFDIHPERTEMPPPQPVDYDLEKLLGELARKDETAGVDPEGTPLRIPWGALARGTAALLALLLLLCYAIKGYRRAAPRLRRGGAHPRLAYKAVLDRLSDMGLGRRVGETRERHAARLDALSPRLAPLTTAHLAHAMGGRAPDPERYATLVREVQQDLKRNVSPVRRLLALLNPIGWLWTR